MFVYLYIRSLYLSEYLVYVHGTKIVFFGFLGGFFEIFLGFFENLISDSESSSNFELEGRLNGSDPILDHWDVHTGLKLLFFVLFSFFKDFGYFWVWKILVMTNSMFLNSKSYKSINNWNFWPYLWPVNCPKENNSQNKTSKINNN